MPAFADAADQPQWGRAWSRNMVSDETGLPDTFDPGTGRNVKWVAELGSQSYASPVVSGGRVLIGTNNDNPRDPRHRGDRAVLLCLDESDGRLLWQLVVPKLSEDLGDPYLDWRRVGFASPPTVEGIRAYTLTNRGEVVCLDMNGMADGNAGPFADEGAHMTLRAAATQPIAPAANDADIVWVCDLVQRAGVRTHDQVQGSVLVHGDLLYVNSCNGVDGTHRAIPSPDAPSLVVLDKRTGRIVARDSLRLGPNTFHVNWSAPSLGGGDGVDPRVFFGGGDGVCYAFEPFKGASPADEKPAQLKDVWRFDPDPAAPKQDVHRWVGNRREGPSVIMGMPVALGGRVYLTAGGDPWWGKQRAWLKCIDAAGSGDVTRTAEVWSYPLPRETCSTAAVYDGMVFVTDVGGHLHCVDAATGKPHWTHKAVGEFWASPLVADGKVYAGTRRGQFVVLAAAPEKRLIAKVDLDEPVHGTAIAANGVLYVPTMNHLYAVRRERDGERSAGGPVPSTTFHN
ncbi:MAG: PQQ-binding-like beta-propeller repeat protein [Tepidisphaeraceae bacterium]